MQARELGPWSSAQQLIEARAEAAAAREAKRKGGVASPEVAKAGAPSQVLVPQDTSTLMWCALLHLQSIGVQHWCLSLPLQHSMQTSQATAFHTWLYGFLVPLLLYTCPGLLASDHDKYDCDIGGR